MPRYFKGRTVGQTEILKDPGFAPWPGGTLYLVLKRVLEQLCELLFLRIDIFVQVRRQHQDSSLRDSAFYKPSDISRVIAKVLDSFRLVTQPVKEFLQRFAEDIAGVLSPDIGDIYSESFSGL